MKLASLKGGRDGRLVVVSTDLERCLPAEVAPTLQAALDNWADARPALEALSVRVDAGEGEPFDQAACHSPLPRAFQWADGSAYVNHVELVRKARGAEMPESFWTDPLMYQGGSDSFLGPRDNIPMSRCEPSALAKRLNTLIPSRRVGARAIASRRGTPIARSWTERPTSTPRLSIPSRRLMEWTKLKSEWTVTSVSLLVRSTGSLASSRPRSTGAPILSRNSRYPFR